MLSAGVHTVSTQTLQAVVLRAGLQRPGGVLCGVTQVACACRTPVLVEQMLASALPASPLFPLQYDLILAQLLSETRACGSQRCLPLHAGGSRSVAISPFHHFTIHVCSRGLFQCAPATPPIHACAAAHVLRSRPQRQLGRCVLGSPRPEKELPLQPHIAGGSHGDALRQHARTSKAHVYISARPFPACSNRIHGGINSSCAMIAHETGRHVSLRP